MNVCIPISEDRGLASPVCGHFGSAPAFLVVDTETRSHRVLANTNAHHEHGHCTPIALLASGSSMRSSWAGSALAHWRTSSPPAPPSTGAPSGRRRARSRPWRAGRCRA